MVKVKSREQSNAEYFPAAFRSGTMEMQAAVSFSEVVACQVSRTFYFRSMYFSTSKMQMHAEEHSVCKETKVGAL